MVTLDRNRIGALEGRRRDYHTFGGCFEPAPKAPFAKVAPVLDNLSGLYAARLRYGGHGPVRWLHAIIRLDS